MNLAQPPSPGITARNSTANNPRIAKLFVDLPAWLLNCTFDVEFGCWNSRDFNFPGAPHARPTLWPCLPHYVIINYYSNSHLVGTRWCRYSAGRRITNALSDQNGRGIKLSGARRDCSALSISLRISSGRRGSEQFKLRPGSTETALLSH